MNSTPELLIGVKGLNRIFTLGSERIHAVRDIALNVSAGELLVITGRSGSGKTTLLNLMGGLDRPTSGTVTFKGQDLGSLSEGELTILRRCEIGFVFQSFGLLPLLSAYENVELPLRIGEWSRHDRKERALACLEMVGLSERASHRPYELSGGEIQRVAIARALAHRPALILADEPTGELDLARSQAIYKLLKDIATAEGVGIVVATHDMEMTKMADSTRQLSDGGFTS